MPIEWKWSTNEPYSRSKRPVKNQKINEMKKGSDGSAYTTSLHDENSWDILNNNIYNGFSVNKREEIDNKMADREMTQQIGFNPFMNNNYVDDISVSNTFLQPVNTKQPEN